MWYPVLRILLAAALLIPGLSSHAQERRTAQLGLNYEILPTGKTTKARFVFVVPTTIAQVQDVVRSKFDPEPDTIITEHQNTYVIFNVKDLDTTHRIKLDMTIDIQEADLKTAKRMNHFVSTPDPLDEFLLSEKFLEKDSTRIAVLASTLQAKTTIKTIRRIYKYVNKEVKYTQYTNMDNGALNTLDTKRSDCSGFADLFVALCRADGIPARVAYGFTTEYGANPRHAWAEAYVGGMGWVRFDPTTFQSLEFGKLRNMYIQLSHIRNDAMLNNGYFYSYQYWGDPIRVNESIEISKSLPLP